MSLTSLKLRNFRCFETLTWEPQPGLNFILGPNAQGKTSILEAACMLLRIKSPRTNTLAEMIRFGQNSFCLEGMFSGEQKKIVITPEGTPRRQLFLDDVLQKNTHTYLSTASLVWFGSDDLAIVSGSSERRRRFLDSAGLQLGSEYNHLLRFYEKALRSRNLLLKEQRPRREIEAYDLPLAESGDQLMALRTFLAQELAPHIAAACIDISGESLALTYKPRATTPMLEALKNSQEEECRLRVTQTGPHRDDLSLLLNGISAATFASEGQRRTIALALKLGLAKFLEEKNSTPPLLLLDDVFGELDQKRRTALLDGIPSGSQALFTTTTLESMEPPSNATLFQLSHDKLIRST